jgi:RimJ/RimL family protein N-acetyltransferase
MEDRFLIMKWRNEQIYHLRQCKPLTKMDQNSYFTNVIAKLFDQEQPNQLLFSYLKAGECIGYGGLVHINWMDKNAEISFIMDTDFEKDHFLDHWTNFLNMIERVAFKALGFHKLFVYAFDLRPHLYTTLQKNGYKLEARLKEHCFYNQQFIDVVIYTKIHTL